MTIPQALDQLCDAMRVRHLSHRTEQSYRLWLQSYMKSLPSRPPGWSSEQKVEAFLTALARQAFLTALARRGVAASTHRVKGLTALTRQAFLTALARRGVAASTHRVKGLIALTRFCCHALSMFYVYVLQSESDEGLYIGYTGDLKRRLAEHQEGKSFSTSYRRPWRLIYYEAYLEEADAMGRERYLKSGGGRRFLFKQLSHHFFKHPLPGDSSEGTPPAA